jgi:hypothetical protein
LELKILQTFREISPITYIDAIVIGECKQTFVTWGGRVQKKAENYFPPTFPHFPRDFSLCKHTRSQSDFSYLNFDGKNYHYIRKKFSRQRENKNKSVALERGKLLFCSRQLSSQNKGGKLKGRSKVSLTVLIS